MLKILKLPQFLFFLVISNSITAQSQSPIKLITSTKNTLLYSNALIENIGQYGKTYKGQESMDTILFGFEGATMPVLFTQKGIVFLQRKVERPSKREQVKLEKQGLSEEEIENKKTITNRAITLEWIGANTNPKILKEEKTYEYHTYGLFTEKAYGYKKITYKNLYNGIDLVYHFADNNRVGFEYSLVVQAGASISQIKMRYGGDIKNIKVTKKGELIVKSDIEGMEQSMPYSYYDDCSSGGFKNIENNKSSKNIATNYIIENNEVSFFLDKYDNSKPIIIDPFVNFSSSSGMGSDVDYDFDGNVFVTSAGPVNQNLLKYNSAGGLQWIFNGALTTPIWESSYHIGGWVVEKNTGNTYFGQAANSNGSRIVRINRSGSYDNYITTVNSNLQENWRMIWNCNGGNSQILMGGGSPTSNLNFGIISPTNINTNYFNLFYGAFNTGGARNDIADMVIDPANNELYTLFSGISINNLIYKKAAPYNNTSSLWNNGTGFVTLEEPKNRPYFGGGYENSANMLAVNANYLFYWDGKNLKAFNKATGLGVGTPLITTNAAKMCGGIYADACNNVYIGDLNGTIKVHNFNGITFNDAPTDIIIPGFSSASVYDLAYNEEDKILYASGNGFVAYLDIASTCLNINEYNLNIVTNCITANATVTILPTVPIGSIINYTLYVGTSQIATNNTGVFSNLIPYTDYTIVASIKYGCSSKKSIAHFLLPAAIISEIITNATCGNNNGVITITASGTTPPYTYSLDGNTYVSNNVFNGLAAGIFQVFVKDANGCVNKKTVDIINSNGPIFTFTQTNSTCASNTGSVTINVTGGSMPYQYSINNGIYQSSNIFSALLPSSYLLKVKDANGCMNAANVLILSGAPISNIITAPTTCGNNNGTINASSSTGVAPLTFSIDGNIYQADGLFSNLASGPYTLYVRDANNCIISSNVIVLNGTTPTITAITTPTNCGNISGTINANGINGIPPLTYSIDNGITFQTSSLFTGLITGNYTVIVKDNVGCTSSTNVTVGNTSNLNLSLNMVSITCANSVITAVATGGIGILQYNINGGAYQASNIFSGLSTGTYIVGVKDANGCIVTKQQVIVQPVTSLSVNATPYTASCSNNANGNIVANGTGGVTPYTFSINGTSYQSSGVFLNVSSGNYTVYIKDANGCIATNTVTVNLLNTPFSGITTFTVSTLYYPCNGNTSATIINPKVDGIFCSSCVYSIDFGPYVSFSNPLFINVTPGIHYVTAFNPPQGCTKTIAVNIVPTTLSTATYTTVAAACGSPTGSITLTGVGTSPYHASINGGTSWVTFNTSTTFSGLLPAPYTIILADNASFTTAPDNPGPCVTNLLVTVPFTNTGTSSPIINCAVATTTSVGFNWAALSGATGYTVSYQINSGAVVNPGPLGNVLTYTVNGLGSGDNVTITVTPTGVGCFVAASKSCIATLCSPSSPIIGYPSSPYCISNTIAQAVTFGGAGVGLGTYTSTPAGLSINSSTGAITPSASTASVTPYTVTYTIAASGGCAAVIATTTVIIKAQVAPIFTNLPTTICNGAVLAALPTTSDNGITGIWSPALNNNTTTPYTFTPTIGLCASTYSSTITVNPILTPTINCGTSTTNSVSFMWAAVAGATGYSVSYIINGVTTNVGGIGNLLTYSVTGLSGGASVAITVTPTGVGCFAASSQFCVATSCSPPSPIISYTGSPFCISNVNLQVVNFGGTGTGGTYTSSPAGLSINTTTGAITPSLSAAGSYSVTYIIAAADGCPAVTTTTAVTIAAQVTPTFNPVAAICNGGTLSALPTTSTNGITGTWSPALSNTVGNIYTFTPTVGQCATTTTLIITVNSNTTPTFNPVAAICSGGALSALPTTSNNGITGTWSPALSNTVGNTYTFTPTVGQCATTTTLIITVNSNTTPTFNPVAAICSGGTLSALPTTSTNGITGTWSPLLSNTASNTYTFIPITATTGQCTTTTTLTIKVNPIPMPNAGPNTTYCFEVAPSLNGTGGIIYEWTPITYLSNPNIANPFVNLPNAGSYTYNLSVTNAAGCKSTTTDAVTIKVLPKARIFVGYDTLIVINQPLQLNAIDIDNLGFVDYTWTSSFGLDDATKPNPIATIDIDRTYTITGTTMNGCKAVDDINIKVFAKADIYVPTAFTPNADGKNDLLRPILVGIKELKYFSVYNRYGELIYKTSTSKAGWDGTIKGAIQNTGAFVWMAEGVDYKGNVLFRKGMCTLVR
jgi:gliding motility-associated-like protein